jgi:hypothetical protein
MRRAATLVLLITASLAGCAKTHITYEKPGATAADVQRDTNECLTAAIVNPGGTIVVPRVDHDTLVRCMEARGYRSSAK